MRALVLLLLFWLSPAAHAQVVAEHDMKAAYLYNFAHLFEWPESRRANFHICILGDEEVITVRPADLLEDELGKVRQEAARYIESEEDVLTYAMFPQVAEKFFQKRLEKKHGLDDTVGSISEAVVPV